jgi:thiamine-monophosphate kinase
MKLADIGEFALIQKLKEIAERTNPPAALVMGIGDDAAAWKSEPGLTLASTDCLVEGVHFTMETTNWYDLGWKSLAVNLSDIAAMGGRARYALVTLGLPRTVEVEGIMQLYSGMAELGKKHGVSIVGGDTSAASCIFINLSIIGNSSEKIMTRTSARPGDKVAISGYLGVAAAGWKLLQQDHLQNQDSPLIRAFLKPQPRLDTGELLLAEGVKTAIDISDGLIADLAHVCRQSKVSATIQTSQLLLHSEATKLFGKHTALEMALTGGEDYELLFCAEEPVINRVKARSNVSISIIGEITDDKRGNVNLVNEDGSAMILNAAGWQHFA